MLQILNKLFGLQEVSSPRVVFVTGLHVFKDGYARFTLNAADAQDPGGGIFVGSDGKKVRKLGGKQEYVFGGYGLGDIVEHPFQKDKNITRRERIEILTGVIHWPRANRRNQIYEFQGPCNEIILRKARNRTGE